MASAPDTTSIPGYTIFREGDYDSVAATAMLPQGTPHPLDQLSIKEIPQVAKLVRDYCNPRTVKFNCITLREPPKAQYAAFKAGKIPAPDRRGFAIIIIRETEQVAEVVVNLKTSKVEEYKEIQNAMPTLTLEDLDVMERIARADSRVIRACNEIGITDMSKIFLDAWAIGIDERWGFDRRLQQGLVYYRNSEFDNQYAHPLDFSVVADTEKEEVLSVDVRLVNGERTAPPLQEHNFLPDFVGDKYNHDRLKPIDITQPEGVSFKVRGNELSWANFKMHIGFNYREGIVISDVRSHDMYEDRERTLFNRISVVEMVVPYGCPEKPHHKKHAFDVGEYGSGLMTNSLKLGCDCKGAIHYMDGVMSTGNGEAAVIKNAICIHEEDNGLLYKHTDYRDGTVISARDRKLIVSQIITAANYEYGFYHTFTLDGTYKLEMKLTGMLNTYCMHPTETAAPYGTQVAADITAHNHQHIFSLRVDPEIDATPSPLTTLSALPKTPTATHSSARRPPLRTSLEGAADYCYETQRSWDIINPNRMNEIAKKPVGYKILNNNCPPLLAKPGSTVYNRAAFARKPLWVTPYKDYELFPAGDYVCQSTGEENHPHNSTILDWAKRNENIENTDIVCYIQFGLTHFPRTEDFPIMPAEPVSVMLRASNFSVKNPGLWVPPSAICVDTMSKNAFASSCCAANAPASSSRL
ncbi:hypothetical protein N7509_003624 [Penicillium cosmopolitanum]|uniref:Amine oxidase n=1 Tax=Penicillium cosmopolitanum TaxID=1131564 RepID=A0A9X0BBM6_9EURO|nr:uncharacterized protein N7509_003624 [Penicillium cosmopolitanum]KAJ5403753.1 hypothetical protein N7509_003624 [Penicillium cosmopolitanum]